MKNEVEKQKVNIVLTFKNQLLSNNFILYPFLKTMSIPFAPPLVDKESIGDPPRPSESAAI